MSGEQPQTHRNHEADVVWTGTIAALGLALLLICIVTLEALAAGVDKLYPDQTTVDAGTDWQLQNRVPGVRPNQTYDRQRLQIEEERWLRQYGWQNRARGIAHVPVNRAIELMADRGLKVDRPEAEEQPQSRTEEP